jgi:hypothetical protein
MIILACSTADFFVLIQVSVLCTVPVIQGSDLLQTFHLNVIELAAVVVFEPCAVL